MSEPAHTFPPQPVKTPQLVLHRTTTPTARGRLEDAIGPDLARRLIAALTSDHSRRSDAR